jgi:hypothetical protein
MRRWLAAWGIAAILATAPTAVRAADDPLKI